MSETSGFSNSCSFAQSRITASTLLPAWRLVVALILINTGTYISFPYRDDVRAARQRKFESAKVLYIGSYIANAMRKGGAKTVVHVLFRGIVLNNNRYIVSLWGIWREFMQRLYVALHGTLGSYFRDPLHEGGADAVA
jgi:hypothetical protein